MVWVRSQSKILRGQMLLRRLFEVRGFLAVFLQELLFIRKKTTRSSLLGEGFYHFTQLI